MAKDNLWILTEERPKESVIQSLLEILKKDFDIKCKYKNIKFVL